MDSTEPTRPGHPATGLPDADPTVSSGARVRAMAGSAGSSFPPALFAERARDRAREAALAGDRPGVADTMAAIREIVDLERDRAARGALLLVGRAIIRGGATETAAVIHNLLTSATVTEVMAVLEDLAGDDRESL